MRVGKHLKTAKKSEFTPCAAIGLQNCASFCDFTAAGKSLSRLDFLPFGATVLRIQMRLWNIRQTCLKPPSCCETDWMSRRLCLQQRTCCPVCEFFPPCLTRSANHSWHVLFWHTYPQRIDDIRLKPRQSPGLQRLIWRLFFWNRYENGDSKR